MKGGKLTMNTTQTKKGFTIIEVVLVLAIAGLIFLMVFVALPALQRGQRDTQRRDDVSRVVSQLQSYATNNRGALPANDVFAASTFQTGYLKATADETSEFKDPKTGVSYVIVQGGAGDRTLEEGQLQYSRGASCNGENASGSGSARQAAIRVKLEGSGYFCQNAQ